MWKVSSGWKVAKRLETIGSSLFEVKCPFEIGDLDLAFFTVVDTIFLNGFF
jgi:hypothetical protein